MNGEYFFHQLSKCGNIFEKDPEFWDVNKLASGGIIEF